MNTQLQRSCSHPLFRYVSDGAWHGADPELMSPCVFVFERPAWLAPSPAQLAKYQHARRIVERLGGHMNQSEWEIAGEAQPLSKDDVEAILEAVQRDNPACRIVTHWNGEGCYTASVAVEFTEKGVSA